MHTGIVCDTDRALYNDAPEPTDPQMYAPEYATQEELPQSPQSPITDYDLDIDWLFEDYITVGSKIRAIRLQANKMHIL